MLQSFQRLWRRCYFKCFVSFVERQALENMVIYQPGCAIRKNWSRRVCKYIDGSLKTFSLPICEIPVLWVSNCSLVFNLQTSIYQICIIYSQCLFGHLGKVYSLPLTFVSISCWRHATGKFQAPFRSNLKIFRF